MRWGDLEPGDLIMSVCVFRDRKSNVPFVFLGFSPLRPGYIKPIIIAPDLTYYELYIRDDADLATFRLIQRYSDG